MSDDLLGGFQVDDDWKAQAQAEKRKLAEERAARPAASGPAAAPAPGASAASPAARPADRDLPDASFETLVQTLASQAMLYMGALSAGRDMVDLDAAKHQLDLLGVVEEKSKGNLTDAEQKTLDVTLYETRMRYVGIASQYIL